MSKVYFGTTALMANLEHFHAAPNLYFQMDRANAIQLLKALVPEWIPVSRRQIRGFRRKR
jgi:hypothetical protein